MIRQMAGHGNAANDLQGRNVLMFKQILLTRTIGNIMKAIEKNLQVYLRVGDDFQDFQDYHLIRVMILHKVLKLQGYYDADSVILRVAMKTGCKRTGLII